MIIRILVIFLLFSATAQAKLFVAENEDGKVTLFNYVPGSRDSLEDVVIELGLDKQTVREVKDLPEEEDFDYWKINPNPFGAPVIVDEAAKNSANQEREQKKTAIENARKKICPECTNEEITRAFES